MVNNWIYSFVFILFFLLEVPAQSIISTAHNLSVSGSGTIKASAESEICIFCHTPHNSNPRGSLWNRQDPGMNYTLYNSSTIQASPGQPEGASMLCLSCHDGTIALGSIISRSDPINFEGGISTIPEGSSNLSTDLSDDHPISFLYDASLSASDGELVDPANLTGPVKLENDRLQCTACHDAHKNLYGQFLVASTQYSELCDFCHQKVGWESSGHRTSTASWNGSGNNPWFHTPYITMSENACENCHHPHSAQGRERLLNYFPEEDNCFDCHNSNVASHNIQSDFGKSYRHDIYLYTQVHNPEEDIVVQNRHVECVDCHNPHVSNNGLASAPEANGIIEGVPGVNTDGSPVGSVEYEYELCYRCHSDSPNKPGSPTSRVIEQNNVRLEFDPTAVSFHPIESPGQNNDVPSLIPPYSETSLIYCVECHASDNSLAGGPHGSIYPHILKFQYETADNTIESYQAYELCYQCHDRIEVSFGTGRFARRVHWRHIVQEDTPCNVCHDPHGISGDQGTITNNSHLINFDLSIVSPNSEGRLEFIDNGSVLGECYLLCHNEDHNPEDY